jgi:hypothetical protein
MPEDLRTPFQEDTAAHQVAASLGFDLVRRYRSVEVLDEKSLIQDGFLADKPKLDFGRISAALDAGRHIAARFRETEYVLRPRRRA